MTGWAAAVETDGAVVGVKLPPAAVLGATWSTAGASIASRCGTSTRRPMILILLGQIVLSFVAFFFDFY